MKSLAALKEELGEVSAPPDDYKLVYGVEEDNEIIEAPPMEHDLHMALELLGRAQVLLGWMDVRKARQILGKDDFKDMLTLETDIEDFLSAWEDEK